MTRIYIKRVSGELLSIEYNNEWSSEYLHNFLYDSLPADERPRENEKWKMMLFLRGEWIIANKQPIVVEDGDILDLFVESGCYEIDIPLENYSHGLWRNMLEIRGCVNIDYAFYVNESTGFLFFDEEIQVDEQEDDDIYYIKNENIVPHVDAHDFTNTLDLPLCVREFVYSEYFKNYSTILPPDAPRPLSYYCNYEWTEEDGKVHIKGFDFIPLRDMF